MSLEERLAGLEAQYGIDRTVLRRILSNAVDDHNVLEALAEKHSCELSAWVTLVETLENRRTQSLQSIECVIAETMELDDGVFGAFSKADCIEILHGLRDEFQRALMIRAESARVLAMIARAYREDGYAGSEIVDAALKEVMLQLTQQQGLPEIDAVAYAAGLAQRCGILPSDVEDARAALLARLQDRPEKFPDLRSMMSSVRPDEIRPGAGLNFDDLANTIQQIALGLWPAPDVKAGQP
jgi:hypothetical protein